MLLLLLFSHGVSQPYCLTFNNFLFRIFKNIWLPCRNHRQQRSLVFRVCEKGKYSLYPEISGTVKLHFLLRMDIDF